MAIFLLSCDKGDKYIYDKSAGIFKPIEIENTLNSKIDFDDVKFPSAMKVSASTISSDLVPVKPIKR